MTEGIHNADCLRALQELPDASVGVTLTDPPYEAECHTLQRRVKRGGELALEPPDFPPMTADGRIAVSNEIARVTQRWALVFCQIEAAHLWRADLEAAGMRYRRTCIWVKPDAQPQLSGDRPGMGYETLLAMHAPHRSRWNGGGRSAVFRHNKNSVGRSGHATQKPLPLIEELVWLFTEPGELVLDPYAGSGTTGVACRKLGRRFLGFEIDPRWVDVARRRIAGHAYVESAQGELF